jgi:hypothetical protein
MRLRQRRWGSLCSLCQLVAIVLLVALAACARPPRWSANPRPAPDSAAILLEGDPLDSVAGDVLPEEIASIPIREKLRPCCAFGTDLGVRVGAVPVPGFRIGNVIGSSNLGPHIYDSGAFTRSSQVGRASYRHRENNGLLYTCRGGFIDTAHVRDYIDWGVYMASSIARNVFTGSTIELGSEGGVRTIVVQPVDPKLVDRYGLARIALRLAEWITFQMSVWHEIATWYGWSWVKTFPETASAFSPEDLYSNLVGVNIAVALGHRRATATEFIFNRGAEAWIDLVIEHLQPVPREVGIEAMWAVDQHWWDSGRRLPDKELTLRRNLDIDDEISPWLVPASLAPESLRRVCGDDPKPVATPNPDKLLKMKFSDWIHLSIDLDDNLAAQAPFTEIGPTVTQADFPRIIEAIRAQNLEEAGPRADQPD